MRTRLSGRSPVPHTQCASWDKNLSVWKTKVRLTSHKQMLQGLVRTSSALKLLDGERYLYLKYCSSTPTTAINDLQQWHILTSTFLEARPDFLPDLTLCTQGSSWKAESNLAAVFTTRSSHHGYCSDGLPADSDAALSLRQQGPGNSQPRQAEVSNSSGTAQTTSVQ